MDTPEIELNLLNAGTSFEAALSKLGLEADAVFWGYDTEIHRHVLVLVTDFFDHVGPLEISRMLFKAYNASLLPSEVDPFLVRLQSINQPAGRDFADYANSEWTVDVRDKHNRPKLNNLPVAAMKTFGVEMRPEWIIKSRKFKKRNAVELGRKWQRFEHNVDREAA